MLQYELQAWGAGYQRVAGLDEAGRGPLAGPVVAAALVFSREFVENHNGLLDGLTDSKKLTEAKRNHFYDILVESQHAWIGVGEANEQEIDSHNILRATYLAMQRAVEQIEPAPDHVLVDGKPVEGLPTSSTAIVKGDSLSLSIAAASVIAKVTRDRIMTQLDATYPQYGFARHKGYGTKVHLDALREHGPSPVHRHSFAPIAQPELF